MIDAVEVEITDTIETDTGAGVVDGSVEDVAPANSATSEAVEDVLAEQDEPASDIIAEQTTQDDLLEETVDVDVVMSESAPPPNDDVSEPEAVEPPKDVQTAPVTQSSSSGALPLIIGGVVAGAIGYGIATFFPLGGTGDSEDMSAQIAQQTQDIAALEAQIADIAIRDLSAIEEQIAQITAATTDQMTAVTEDMSARLAVIDDRLVEVEKRPNSDGTLSETALAAYQRELEELRADLDAQQETVMSAAAQAEADLATAREEAALLEQAAIAQAQAAAARAALNRVATAVETGAPFAAALADLDVADLPAALTSAADTGVATTAALVEEFPAAARAALATARTEGVSDDAGGLGGFLRSQFDVRSTAPRDGSGPDAILSRAEAAVKEGRTADALAELEALPEVARAELTDWTARATERADVLDAIATLSETFN